MKRVYFRICQFGTLTKYSSANYKLNILPVQSKPQLLAGYQKCGYLNQKDHFSTNPDKSSTSEKETNNNKNDKIITTTTTSSEVARTAEEFELTPEMEAREKYFSQKREILRLDENDPALIDTGVGKARTLSLLEVREGDLGQSGLKEILKPPTDNQTDLLAWIQQDIDIRPESIRRFLRNRKEQVEIKLQTYSTARHSVLGHDLAAAHFVTYRGGKVKFMGYDKWVDHYRPEQDEDDEIELPKHVAPADIFILPVKYDPNFLVTGIDCSNVTSLRYEGLKNLGNLQYCTWLKFENCIHMDAWCIDRLASYFEDRLEHLDLSGCTALTEGALCAVARFRKLKTLVVKDIPQITNKDVICAWLEEMNPELTIIGTDYEQKLHEVKMENERLEKKTREEEENTITIDVGAGPDSIHRITAESELTASSSNKQ